jgi:ubiquinone biosynthesis protein COQ9
MNWYTRRASLAACYSAADVFMTQDLSPNYTETERFLERRLDQAAWVGSSTHQVKCTHILQIRGCALFFNIKLVGYYVDIWG